MVSGKASQPSKNCEERDTRQFNVAEDLARLRLKLVRQRIRPQLKLYGFAGCAFAAFDVPGGAGGVG